MDIKFEESLALIRKDRKNFALLPYDIKNNKEFIKLALHKSNGLLGIDIKYLSDELRDDRDFIKEIINIRPTSLVYASKELQNDCSQREQVLRAGRACSALESPQLQLRHSQR